MKSLKCVFIMENNAVEIDFGQELGERQIRRVYLITYSQADMKKMANLPGVCRLYS